MKKGLKTRALAYLENYGGPELSSETKTAIKEKRIWLEDEPLYVRAKIAGGGEIELLTANLDESVGVTNIDKRKLPKFVNFVLSRLSFGYGSSAVANNTVAVDATYSNLIGDCPVQLRHANLIIKQNDNPIITMPISQLLQQEKVREANGEAGYELDYMRLIKEDVPFQISIKFPEGKALEGVVNHHFVEVFLKGARTRLRGAK